MASADTVLTVSIDGNVEFDPETGHSSTCFSAHSLPRNSKRCVPTVQFIRCESGRMIMFESLFVHVYSLCLYMAVRRCRVDLRL
jgi:hypothetical protein